MTIRPKRQSTTSKVTLATLARIAQDCTNGTGVIVRHRGREYGVVGVEGQYLCTLEGATLFYRDCTILRTTIFALPMDGETRIEHEHYVHPELYPVPYATRFGLMAPTVASSAFEARFV